MTRPPNSRSLARQMSAVALIALGLAAALAYAPLAARPASAARSILKTVPVATFALASVAGAAPWPVGLGLALSAAGDLALSRPGPRAFLAGLAAFAAAHVAYLAAFLPLAGWPSAPGWAVAALVVGLAASTEVWLAPHAGDMRGAVRVYVALIAAMALAALAAVAAVPLATLGAFAFLASDLVLAVVLFRLREGHWRAPALSRLLWVAYIGGQALILAGFLPG